MSTSNKIIKYISISFAIFLTITIIEAILSGIYGIYNMVKPSNDNNNDNDDVVEIKEVIDSNISNIDMDLIYNSLVLKHGDKLLIEGENSNIQYEIEDDTLIVKEKKYKWNGRNKKRELSITIPRDIVLNKLNIDSGAGTVIIDGLSLVSIDLNLGAGSTKIKGITCSRADIDTGAGELIIDNGNINNLDLDMGVGDVNISGILTGNNKIDTGIGALNLNLSNSSNNYTFKVEKGIGKVLIDNTKVEDNEVIGSGSSYIVLNGGIGDIKVNFNK